MRSNQTIFLVQGSALLRRAVHETLEEDGLVVSGASNFHDALLAVRNAAYDVLIVELIEPEFSEGQVKTLVGAALGTPAVIVLREPSLRLDSRPESLSFPADVVLDKPVDPDEIRVYVRQCLLRRSTVHRSAWRRPSPQTEPRDQTE